MRYGRGEGNNNISKGRGEMGETDIRHSRTGAGEADDRLVKAGRCASTHEGWSICHGRGHPMSRATRPQWHLTLALWGRRGGGEGVVAGEEGEGGRRGRGGECGDGGEERKR
ncbi:hypothetical protein E2C01_036548 [Portunus trituberculatus]|uniref:Uncharacterized protein n=1 Tax=Portunus trituberculatus TaxID=210409 RepID=A0A5B7FBP2_PORTR|nr:hypothetical protein [Portunus trituberculatus]